MTDTDTLKQTLNNKTSVESVKLGKTSELSKIIRKSSHMLDWVNCGHRQKHLGSS